MTTPLAEVNSPVPLPAEWGTAPLSDHYLVNYGRANPGRNGNVPVIGSSGIYAWTDEPLFDRPTVVVGRKGSAGQPWLIEGPSYPSDTTFYLEARSRDFPDLKFTYFALMHFPLSASNDVIPSLQRHELENWSLPLPPLQEQRAIAHVLAKIRAAVEVQEKTVATLKELKAATMAKLFREGLRGEPLKQTEIGEIPESWQVLRLGDMAKVITKGSSPNWQGFDYSRSGIQFVRSQNVGWGGLRLQEIAHLPTSFNQKEPRSVLVPGDLLINIVGASIGRAAVADERIRGANINQAVALVRLPDDKCNPSFIMYFLLTRSGFAQMLRQKKDIARANLSLEDVRSFVVPLPDRAEQDEIAHALLAVGDRTVLAERTHEGLTSTFALMLHLLMTGRVRVTPRMIALQAVADRAARRPKWSGKVDEKILKEIVGRIVEAVAPEKIILFGSAARGEMGPDSDLDLLVVKSCDNRREVSQAIYRNLRGIGVPKDVVVVTPEDIDEQKDIPGMVVRAALREGKLLYAA